MNKYIKYKRFNKTFNHNSANHSEDTEIQEFLNELIVDGYEIIYYNETVKSKLINITVLCGKIRQII